MSNDKMVNKIIDSVSEMILKYIVESKRVKD